MLSHFILAVPVSHTGQRFYTVWSLVRIYYFVLKTLHYYMNFSPHILIFSP